MDDTQLAEIEHDGGLVLREAVPLDRQPALIYLAGLSASSRPTMGHALDVIAGMLTGEANALTCDWSKVRYQHVAAIRARLAEVYAPKTCNLFLTALRGALRAAWLTGAMTAEDYHRAAAVEAVRGERLPAGRHVTAGEIAALMAACAADPSPVGARDAAMIGLLYGCGLRRAEVADLDRESFDAATGELRVLGKGNKERQLFVVNGTAEALADWLTIRGDDPGPLFWPVNKGGKLERGHRLTVQAVHGIVQKRRAQAGVGAMTCHDLRRTFAGDLLDAGADVSTVQRLMGHASPTTTAAYDRRPAEARRRAVERLHVPYTRRADLQLKLSE